MSVLTRYNLRARLLHWLMAPLLLAMLFIGAGMITSLRWRPTLLVWHVPLGLMLLVLVGLRLMNAMRHPIGPLPETLPRWQVVAAIASHRLLYALMIAMPLLGWAMQSAGGLPIIVASDILIPPILPPDPTLYALARTAHGLFARLLFAIILIHLSAGLFHAWVLRDGVFNRIGLWRRRS